METQPEKRRPDWIAWMKDHAGDHGDEIELADLEEGDRLRIKTANTDYFLEIMDPVNRDAVMFSSRPDRPEGPVRIMGCTFGLSSSIKPDALFCGGSLEVLLGEGALTHTTSAIESVSLIRQRDSGEATP